MCVCVCITVFQNVKNHITVMMQCILAVGISDVVEAFFSEADAVSTFSEARWAEAADMQGEARQ